MSMLNESCKLYERYVNTPGSPAESMYFYPRWAGHFICNPDFYINRQGNDSILLLYTLGGCGKLKYRECEYILTEKNFALLNCMDLQIYYPLNNEEWEFYFIHFSGNKSKEFCEYLYSINDGVVFESSAKIKEYVENCITMCRDKTPGFEIKMSKQINDILYEMIWRIQKDEGDRVLAICEYISENYSKYLTTESLAKEFNFSRCYFSTLFKRMTGTTLHDYLTCCRLDKAKHLLKESSLSVEEIAEKTGFVGAGTFIRAFKRKEKITPLQYKKNGL